MSRQRTGSIDLRPTGYRVRLTINGKRESLKERFATREEAERHRAAALSILVDETDDGVTLADWGEKVLTQREVGREVRDFDGDWDRWRQHVVGSALAKRPIKLLRTVEIRRWSKAVRTRVAAQTTKNALNLVRVVLERAVDEEMLPRNPALGIRVKPDKRTTDPWTYLEPAEQDRLIAATEPIVHFALGSGLRAGELCALRSKDVVTEGDNPHVVVRYGSPPVEPTKGGRIRRVPLFGLSLAAMKAHKVTGPNPHGLAFPRVRGGYRDPAHVLRWDAWKKALADAKIERDFRWHDLRHTSATSLLAGWWGRRWSLEEVQQYLGHRSRTTTERYAHAVEDLLRRAGRESARNWPREAANPAAPPGRVELPTNGLGNPRTPTESLTGYDAAGQLVAELYKAVATGDALRANAVADALTEIFLSPRAVTLSLEIRQGGPHKLTRAMELGALVIAELSAAAVRRSA